LFVVEVGRIGGRSAQFGSTDGGTLRDVGSPRLCDGFKVELAGLEPATSWVRYRPNAIA
jgi:hypothetical protein